MKRELFSGITGLDMNYIVYTPEKRSAGLPLITYLHGAGERGKNADHLSRHAIPKMMENGFEIEAVVLCPQCPANLVFNNIPLELKQIIDTVCEKYVCDKTRITVTGSSMGGYGTYMLGMTFPNVFAGLAPVAAGGMEWRAPNLISTPVYAFHGEDDRTIPYEKDVSMVDAINHCGGNAKLKIIPGYGHNDGINYIYGTGEVTAWLLAQKRTDFSPVPETLSKYF